jgi:xanthine dehydrogenase YagR molybdenum-binding subunit
LRVSISIAETSNSNGGRRSARTSTEQALHADQVGDQEKADQRQAEAQRIDAEEVESVLREQQPIRPGDTPGQERAGPASTFGVAPAIANAVYNATGRRVRHLPITPERILEVL